MKHKNVLTGGGAGGQNTQVYFSSKHARKVPLAISCVLANKLNLNTYYFLQFLAPQKGSAFPSSLKNKFQSKPSASVGCLIATLVIKTGL